MSRRLRKFSALVCSVLLLGSNVFATDRTRLMDFDGDGATDIAVFDAAPWAFPIQQTYFRYRSSANNNQLVVVPWGLTLDTSAVADYDGDDKADPTIHRWVDVDAPQYSYNSWWIKGSQLGDYVRNFGPVGMSTFEVLSGDYDNDGKAEPAFTHVTCDFGDPNDPDDDYCQHLYTYAQPPNDESFTSQIIGYSVGTTAYGHGIGAAGDYDGDYVSDIAVYDLQTQKFKVYARPYTTLAENIDREVSMDIDFPAPGDFNGDGRTDFVGVKNYQSSSDQPLIWKVRYNFRGGPGVEFEVAWGWSYEHPVPGDYDGDGTTDFAVYDRNTSTWTIRRSSDLQTLVVVLGGVNDTPVTFPTQNAQTFHP